MPRSAEAQPWFRRSVLHSQPTRSARAVAHTPTRVGAPAARAECVRLPRARGGVRPTHIPLPATPPAARALRRARARGCLAAQAHECVLPSTPHPRRPYLLSQPLRCVLCLRASPPLATPNAGKAFFTPASTLPSLFPTYLSTARAPRPRNPPPTRMHTAPYSSP